MAALGRRIDVQLSDEEYALLKVLAERHDSSVSELIRQAIRQVYMNEVDRDLTAFEAQRLDETSLLMDREGGSIGIRRRELLAEEDSFASD
jgi:predicted transcriptional regulator